ncbi:MAG: acylphosphatase [Anaerolineae bacterium]
MNTSEQTQLHAIIHGHVQGVSFRHYTTQKAQELALVGWVYNRPDGTVEVLAEGTHGALTELAQWLETGSPHARVQRVDVTWGEAVNDYTQFKTRYVNEG